MKNHELFFEAYSKIEDDKERLGFLRGYLFALSPKEMTRFMVDNFEAGFQAYEQIFGAGAPEEKLEAKAELDKHFALLSKHPMAAA